ncbi:MAG TPA: DUF1302 family protein [Burkholderiales bacterium]|nr:DUF1302 family protein [Burkholderiales bacterium]
MTRPLLASLLLAPGAPPSAAGDDRAAAFQTSVRQEISAGGMIRVQKRDVGLIGGGNGGTGTSVNFDDGNLNYGRGFTALGVQGRTLLDGKSATAELKVEAVYFYDFINAGGETDFHPLSEEARSRAGRNLYLNEAYGGLKGRARDAMLGVRLGNQILRWSDSPSFGYSIAPVNPVSASRRYQPGNTAADSYVALPMLSGKVESAGKWTLQGFYLFGFEPTETEASGTFLSGNDYYSPGGRYLQLGQGSPLVPDTDASVVTPGTPPLGTPFGSRVPRTGDRTPGSGGQFGAKVSTPEMGAARLALAGYAMRVHSREPVVSVRTGTLGGLLGTTAPDYTSSGSYFLEYLPDVTILGASARVVPTSRTRLSLDYSMRLRQPLQIDDEILITAGLAPAAAVGACAPNPASAGCARALAALNSNPIIASRGGITAASAASLFSTEISGYERFNVSQYSLSLAQGLPPVLGARQWSLAAEAGGVYVHGFRERFLDASVSVRPDASGARRPGLASRSSWGYRLFARLDYADLMGMQSVSPSLTWIHDVKENAPITLGTLLEGVKSVILAVDFGINRQLGARVSYRSYLGKGNNADRYTDRDFVQFALTRKF